MWAALILVALAAGAAAGNSSCACSAGFPPLPAGGFKSISGYAGCIINYVQFEDATGAVVFTSGMLSGGEPFSVSCPGNNTITGFSYLCNSGSGPNGAFPTSTFASLSTVGGITCSNGSAPFYSGALDENVCELASGYTQLGFLDCSTDGSAPLSCSSRGYVRSSDGHQQLAAPWPMVGGNQQHTGASPYQGPLQSPKLGLNLTFPGGSSDPVIGADGTVFVSTPQLSAINASTGVFLWNASDNYFCDVNTPAIGPDGTVYVATGCSGGPHIYAFNGSSGELRWQQYLGFGILSPLSIGPDGTLYGGLDVPEGSGNPDLGAVFALDGSTGNVRWRTAPPQMGGVRGSPAIGSDGSIYVGTTDFKVYAFNGNTGAVRWTYATGAAIYSSPSIGADGTIFIGSSDNKLYALSPASGALRWSYPTGGSIDQSPSIGANGLVYVGSTDKNIYAVSISTGTLSWSYATGSFISTPAIGSDGTVYVGSDSFYAFDGLSGNVRWTFTSSNLAPFSSPAIGADGGIYVISRSQLYALQSTPA